MLTDRRDFLAKIAAGSLLGALPLSDALGAMAAPPARAESWDLSWVDRIAGKHRAVFDIPAIESGYGVWRATFWAKQYMDVLGAKKPGETVEITFVRNGTEQTVKARLQVSNR